MFQEYPKCLYLQGDTEGEYVIAMDAEQESDAREAGFSVAGEAQTENKAVKRGRKAKNNDSD